MTDCTDSGDNAGTTTGTGLTPSQRLRLLFNTLTCYKVVHWGASSADPDMADREVADVKDADVVSSLRMDGRRHAVVLDIDHPAWLVKSTTEGHYHLYIDVPGGIDHNRYMFLLSILADAGIIERGYASASIERGYASASITRGHSDVRLPWVKKVFTFGTATVAAGAAATAVSALDVQANRVSMFFTKYKAELERTRTGRLNQMISSAPYTVRPLAEYEKEKGEFI